MKSALHDSFMFSVTAAVKHDAVPGSEETHGSGGGSRQLDPLPPRRGRDGTGARLLTSGVYRGHGPRARTCGLVRDNRASIAHFLPLATVGKKSRVPLSVSHRSAG